MTYSVANLRNACNHWGGILERDDTGRYTTYQCCAPEGKRWNMADLHMLCVTWRTGDAQSKQDAIHDAIKRMKGGLVDCNEPDCDYCNPLEEE